MRRPKFRKELKANLKLYGIFTVGMKNALGWHLLGQPVVGGRCLGLDWANFGAIQQAIALPIPRMTNPHQLPLRWVACSGLVVLGGKGHLSAY
jgi:hypothetical protein